MSLKDNIEMVKEELNSEEKFFEKSVITERFIKKYKNLLIGTAVAIVVIIGANVAISIKKQNDMVAVNEAFLVLLQDEKNSQALLTIKDISPDLYDVWNYSVAIANKDMITLKELTNSKDILVSDLSSYELAQDSQTSASLDAYASKQDAVYKDLAIVQSAIILMNESKMDLAHDKLAQIQPQSSLNKIANALLHYGVK